MAYTTEINPGDYIRACVKLQADPDARTAIATLLGLAPAQAATAAATPVTYEDAPLSGSGVEQSAEAINLAGAESEEKPHRRESPMDRTDLETIPAKLTSLQRVRVQVRLEARMSLEDSSAESPEPDPLFDITQTRAIVSRTLARVTSKGPWDFDQVVEKCARGEALASVPRLPQASLSSGVQLLIDRGEALMVFAQDQARLAKTIVRLAGEDKTQILSFSGFPSRAGSGGMFRWKAYEEQLPPPGTVVALLTDFGIGRPAWLASPAPSSQWREFAERLRNRQCPLVAFVPYAPHRWPQDLTSAITFIHWDRSTGTSAVHAAIGKGLRSRHSN